MTSIARVMEANISIPGYSCISKRSVDLSPELLSKAMEPGNLAIVDSTGLKVYGKDEWHQEKHTVPARRTWRKLHLAVAEKHQLIASELTTTEVGDPPRPSRISWRKFPVASMRLLLTALTMAIRFIKRFSLNNLMPLLVIPPDKTAVLSATGDTQRDQHIDLLAQRVASAFGPK